MAHPSTAPLHDPDTYTTGVPFDLLEQLRARGPVHWVDEPELPGLPAGSGYHLVIDHGLVTEVVRDAATYSSALGGTQIRDPATERDLHYVQRMMLNMDPPEHTRLRRMIAASFTPRAVRALEDRIAGHAERIVDRMLAGPQECDFAKDVAADLPLLTLADILGVPAEDRWLMFDWSNRVIGFLDPDYASSASFDAGQGTSIAREAVALRPAPDADGRMPDPRGRDGMPDLYHYAHLLGDAKRAEPGDDVMSILLAQRSEDGGELSVEEFENMFWLFAVAGNETLRNGLPGAMIALLSNPDTMTTLRADPSLIPGAVDELLRWWTPVMTFRRTATCDTVLAGTAIAAGDKVVVSYLGANRDPAVFERSDELLIGRKPNNHRVFGHGPHVCVGAHFARVQMTHLFREVLGRTRAIQLAGEPVLLRSNFQRGVKRLPISWE
ncbi:cytochrome P450 [Flexivirga endophytica]|uniref:Cytochrome P450 n=1 Tax=Flexivirga endophytica TaxID=1849103 RepID=A0A916WTH4_9MICO|nr:cytochrome P450 [Flexivirga endophytica]GGB28451.1 cytochrome P450 [Flexivirga endophytica]GHB62156.1 cytochrome P450 [Flexivirga endophytica]